MANNGIPTRKDRIIDLTIASTTFSQKITDWKVQQEVYLNTDHSLISFNIGEKIEDEILERLDFRQTNWSEWEKACTDAMEEWLESRNSNTNVNEDYGTLVKVFQETTEKVIPKKKVCKHSRGWWNNRLSELSKEYKKVKRQFAKK